MNRRMFRLFPLLGLLLALALLAGCTAVQANKFTAFKDAAAAVTTQSQAAYDEVQALWMTLGAECLAVPMAADDYIKSIKFMPTASPCGESVGKSPKANMDVRMKALKAMSSYAAAVNMLATTDYVGGFDASLAKLDTSLTSLGNALADEQGLDLKTPANAEKAKSAISKTVSFLGKAYLEKERKKLLRDVLKEAQDSLDAMSVVFADDNMSISNLERVFGEKYLKIRATMRAEKDHDKLLAYDAKVIAEYNRVSEVRKVLDAQSEAVKAMPDANRALLESLDKDDPGIMKNIEKFIATAQEVRDIVQAWQKL